MNGFELEPLALGEVKLPRLTDLELKNCGVVMTPENQAVLLSLDSLDSLNLSNNPLGTFPDLNLLPQLDDLDLSNCGLTVVPEGLTSHPGFRTVVLAGNRITQLPDALFDLPPIAVTPLTLPTTRYRQPPATRSRITSAAIETTLTYWLTSKTLPSPGSCFPV